MIAGVTGVMMVLSLDSTRVLRVLLLEQLVVLLWPLVFLSFYAPPAAATAASSEDPLPVFAFAYASASGPTGFPSSM